MNESSLTEEIKTVEWLGVPLLRPDKSILGTLVMQKLDGTKFNDDDKKLVSFAVRQLVLSVEKKNSEIILQRNEKQLRNLFDKNPLMIFPLIKIY